MSFTRVPSYEAAGSAMGTTASTPTPTSGGGGPSLHRSESRTSISSIHARNALRRMATHETGHGVDKQRDGRAVGGGSGSGSGTGTIKAARTGMRKGTITRATRARGDDMHTHPEADGGLDTPRGSSEGSVGGVGGNRSVHAGVGSRAVVRDQLNEGEEVLGDGVGHNAVEGSDTGRAGKSAFSTEGEDVKGGAGSSEEGNENRNESGNAKPIELQDQTNLLPVRQVLVVFAGLSMALFASMLDQTIVTTALPTLGQVFNRADIVSWTGTAFLLTSTAMQPIYGRLSDIFGRKPSLLVSCVIFFLGALGCSLSQSMIMLICFRAVQGIGGGGILTLSMIIVSDIVTLEERGKYQGIIGIVIATGNSIGPVIGGSLTERASWRWCWWLTLPITSAAFFIILFLLPLRHIKGSITSKLRQIDWAGSVLTLAWAVLVLIALSWAGSQHAWDSAAVLVPLIIGLALLGCFILVEMRFAKLPLIPLHIFRQSTVAAGMVITFCSGVAFYVTLYYLPTYFQVVRGASAIQSGVLILPLTCVQTVCVFISGYITSKTGDYYWNLVVGFALWTIGLGVMSTIGPDTPDSHLIGYQVLIGIGAGQTFQTSLVAIQASVERRDMAIATGTRNFVRMLGGTVGLAACASMVNNLAAGALKGDGYDEGEVGRVLRDPVGLQGSMSAQEVRDLRVAFARGINGVFYLLIPLVGLSFILTVLFIKKVPLKRADDQAKKEEAKEWVRQRKEKHARKAGKRGADGAEGADEEKGSAGYEKSGMAGSEGDDRVTSESRSATVADSDSGHDRHDRHAIKTAELEVQDAARGLEEAVGVGPTPAQGMEQGPIGSKRV